MCGPGAPIIAKSEGHFLAGGNEGKETRTENRNEKPAETVEGGNDDKPAADTKEDTPDTSRLPTRVYEVQSSLEYTDAQPREWPYASPKSLSPNGLIQPGSSSGVAATSPVPSKPLGPKGVPAPVEGKEKAVPAAPAEPTTTGSEARDATYFRILGCVWFEAP